MVGKFWRKAVAWSVTVGLLSGLPLVGGEIGSGRQAVGQVIQSSAAALGGVGIPGVGTVISGDLLTTAKEGRALVRFSATAQASLLGESSVIFRAETGTLSAELLSGTLVTETSGKDSVIVETPKYWAESPAKGTAIYLVKVFPDKSILVTARRGRILIKELTSGRSYLVPEGSTAISGGDSSAALGKEEKEEPKQLPSIPAGPSVEGPAPAGGVTGKPTAKPKSNSTLYLILGGGAAAGIGGALAAAGGGGAGGGGPASPSHP